MAVRFNASGEALARARLAGARTIMGWFRIVTDRNAVSTLLVAGDRRILVTGTNGTTLRFYDGVSYYSGTDLTVGTWYHLTLTIADDSYGTCIAYVNGVEDINRAFAGATDSGSMMVLGNNGIDQRLDGNIAHVKMWSAVLSVDEIQQEMHSVVPVRTANLDSWYPLDLHSDMVDWSGNGNTLTAYGTLTTEDNPPVSWGGASAFPQFVSGGGGTNYNQSAVGALAPAAALIRQSTALRAGATTPAGALLRTTSTARAGATTPAGAATKQTGRALGGAAAPSGALSSVKLIVRALSGAFEPAGALARAMARTVAGAITPAAAALKQTGRALTGNAAPSGALSSIKLFLVEMAGAFAPTGGLLRTTARALAGATAPTGAALKSTARALAGAVTASAALSSIKTFLAYIEGAVTAAGALARTPLKTLSGAIAPAAAIMRSTTRALAGSVAPSGVASGLRLVFVTLAGAIAPVGGLVRQMTRPLAGAITPAAAVTKAIARQLTGAVSAIGALIASALGLNPLAQATASDALVYSAITSDSSVYLGAASDMAAFSAAVTDAIAG